MILDPSVFVPLAVAISSGVLGWSTYRRSRHNDEVAERAGVATTQSTSIGQVVEGLDRLVANLQEDNAQLRTHVKELNVKLDRIIAECQDLKRQLGALGANPHPSNG